MATWDDTNDRTPVYILPLPYIVNIKKNPLKMNFLDNKKTIIK